MKEKSYRPPRLQVGKWYGNEAYIVYIVRDRNEDKYSNMLYDFVLFSSSRIEFNLSTVVDYQLPKIEPDLTLFHDIFKGIFNEKRGKAKLAKLI